MKVRFEKEYYLFDGLIREERVGGGGSGKNIQHQRVFRVSHHANENKAPV